MSRRRTNPDTGEPELTHREQIFINEYIKNGGNATEAAIAAGYGSARANQSAYQVLHRLRVQQHINDRVAESTVSAGEIIGTLAAFMRGRITDILDDNGDFDINVVRERRLGHLLKSVTRTTRKLESQPGQDPEFVQDYRIQLHSPVQAASILARLVGLNRRTWDLQTGHLPGEDSSPDSLHYNTPGQDSGSAEPSIDYHQSPQDDLPDSVPADLLSLAQSSPPGLANNGSDYQSTERDSLPPVLKDIASDKAPNLPPASSQTSTASPQHSPLKRLERIGRALKNFRKINMSQCLAPSSAQQHGPFARNAMPCKNLIALPCSDSP